MTEKAIIFTTDNKIELRDLELKDGSLLEALQAVVGGHIEIVHPRYLTKGLVMVVNEEGLIEGLPLNLYASILYGVQDHGQPIVGNVAILDQGYRDGEPDIVGLGELLALDRYVYFKKSSEKFQNKLKGAKHYGNLQTRKSDLQGQENPHADRWLPRDRQDHPGAVRAASPLHRRGSLR